MSPAIRATAERAARGASRTGVSLFLGGAVAEEALRRGWEVSVFNRGRSGVAPAGVREIRGDRTIVADLDRLAASGLWDAVVDTSASELAPRDVLADWLRRGNLPVEHPRWAEHGISREREAKILAQLSD